MKGEPTRLEREGESTLEEVRMIREKKIKKGSTGKGKGLPTEVVRSVQTENCGSLQPYKGGGKTERGRMREPYVVRDKRVRPEGVK